MGSLPELASPLVDNEENRSSPGASKHGPGTEPLRYSPEEEEEDEDEELSPGHASDVSSNVSSYGTPDDVDEVHSPTESPEELEMFFTPFLAFRPAQRVPRTPSTVPAFRVDGTEGLQWSPPRTSPAPRDAPVVPEGDPHARATRAAPWDRAASASAARDPRVSCGDRLDQVVAQLRSAEAHKQRLSVQLHESRSELHDIRQSYEQAAAMLKVEQDRHQGLRNSLQAILPDRQRILSESLIMRRESCRVSLDEKLAAAKEVLNAGWKDRKEAEEKEEEEARLEEAAAIHGVDDSAMDLEGPQQASLPGGNKGRIWAALEAAEQDVEGLTQTVRTLLAELQAKRARCEGGVSSSEADAPQPPAESAEDSAFAELSAIASAPSEEEDSEEEEEGEGDEGLGSGKEEDWVSRRGACGGSLGVFVNGYDGNLRKACRAMKQFVVPILVDHKITQAVHHTAPMLCMAGQGFAEELSRKVGEMLMAPQHGNGEEGAEAGDDEKPDGGAVVVDVTAADVREAFDRLCWGGAKWQEDKGPEVQFVAHPAAGTRDAEGGEAEGGEEAAAEGVRVSVRVRELELESALAESERRAAKAEAKAAALLAELGRGAGQHLSRNAEERPGDQGADQDQDRLQAAETALQEAELYSESLEAAVSRVLARAPGRNSPGAALLLPGPGGSATEGPEERMAWVQRAEQALHGLVERLLERERRVAELKAGLGAERARIAAGQKVMKATRRKLEALQGHIGLCSSPATSSKALEELSARHRRVLEGLHMELAAAEAARASAELRADRAERTILLSTAAAPLPEEQEEEGGEESPSEEQVEAVCPPAAAGLMCCRETETLRGLELLLPSSLLPGRLTDAAAAKAAEWSGAWDAWVGSALPPALAEALSGRLWITGGAAGSALALAWAVALSRRRRSLLLRQQRRHVLP